MKKKRLSIWLVHITPDGWWAELRGLKRPKETKTLVSVTAYNEADAISRVFNQRMRQVNGLDD